MTTDALIIKGDCLNVMAGLPAASIDAIVTDPPYGLSFMGKDWDKGVPGESFWREALRVAKPGCHLLAFGGTRTFHRLTVAIEDAGWEIRDCIMWVYGSGFPKSLDVSKAIDKEAGAKREVLGYKASDRPNVVGQTSGSMSAPYTRHTITEPQTNAARQWQGWGTALKPAWEPIIVARKPLDGTVAENVQRHGCGGLNVDGCRVETADVLSFGSRELGDGIKYGKCKPTTPGVQNQSGRWPANFIHDGSDDITSGLGSASRFFYTAKASPSEREEGLNGLPENELKAYGNFNGTVDHPPKLNIRSRNHHPTVKPVDLMKYLCRLITPPGGLILDPFCGSGSTGVAAMREGFNFIGIELNQDYAEIARRRIDHERNKTPLFSNVI